MVEQEDIKGKGIAPTHLNEGTQLLTDFFKLWGDLEVKEVWKEGENWVKGKRRSIPTLGSDKSFGKWKASRSSRELEEGSNLGGES